MQNHFRPALNVHVVYFQVSFPLEYTPRKFVVHAETAKIIMLETEHNAYTEDTKKQRRVQMAEVSCDYRCRLSFEISMMISVCHARLEFLKQIMLFFTSDDLFISFI